MQSPCCLPNYASSFSFYASCQIYPHFSCIIWFSDALLLSTLYFNYLLLPTLSNCQRHPSIFICLTPVNTVFQPFPLTNLVKFTYNYQHHSSIFRCLTPVNIIFQPFPLVKFTHNPQASIGFQILYSCQHYFLTFLLPTLSNLPTILHRTLSLTYT